MLVNQRTLPKGFAVALPNPDNNGKLVHYDDCNLTTGAMIDAKGTGYLKMLQYNPDAFPWKGVEDDLIQRADKQVAAAQGRPIDWYFAERRVAERVTSVFAEKRIPIRVIYAPWQP